MVSTRPRRVQGASLAANADPATLPDMSVMPGMPTHTATAVAVLGVLGVGMVAFGTTASHPRHIPLYSEGVAVTPSGTVVGVPTGVDPDLHSGTRVLLDPTTTDDDDLAAEQRAWLAAGEVPGTGGPYTDMVSTALLDLHVLLRDDGAAVAGWSHRWRYVWPRDASFVAVALARTGHQDDALAILDFLAGVQEPDGSFEARYLPDGSGTPDDREAQSDGTGWALWAAGEVVAAVDPADRPATARRLGTLIELSADHAADLVGGDGLPPASADFWEVGESELTLGTVAPLLAGLEAADDLLVLLGDDASAARARTAAGATRGAVEREFGDDTDYGRYGDGAVPDAASAFALPPFQPTPLAGALDAWQASAGAMARPAGGLAPGAGWRQDGVSWTPQTALYALTAADNDRPADARDWLDWLDAHRTAMGALPEKVLADGSPAAVAPLAWTAACVVLAVDTLDP